MAIKVQGTTVIDDSRNIINIGIATVGSLDVNKISSDGIDYGQANYVLTSGGPSGNISWKVVTDVGAGILDAVFIRQNGSNVGSGTATTFDFYENFSLTQPSAGIASVRLANTLNIGGLNVSGVSTFQGNVFLGDDDRLRLGDSQDLQIYHDGSHSYIKDAATGNLYLESDGGGVIITKTGPENIARFLTDGAVELYYDNSKKFETTGAGATVFGTLETQQLNVSGVATATTFVGSLTGTATSTTNIPNLSGDITSVNTVTTLATVNSNVGTYGDVGAIPRVTVNAKGLVTGVTTVAPNNGTLTLAVSGTGLSGSASFTANQSGNSTFTVTSNATSVNTNSTIVARNASGGFSAGIITATQFSTGASGVGVNINTNTISGPSELIIDPAAVGDNTGLVRIKGDLYVDGTTTQINSTSLEIADFVVGIASTATTDLLADGAGIKIGPDNTFLYEYNSGTNPSLKSSENLNVASGKVYQIGETERLSANTLSLGTGTTIHSPAGNVLSLGVNNAEKVKISNSNVVVFENLGVKVSSPASNTQVAIAGTLGISEVGGSGTRTLISSSGNGFYLNHNDNSNIIIQSQGSNKLAYQLSNNSWSIPSGGTALLIGTGSTTGTASQPLQVTGGAYVSGSVGIGTTNPTSSLDIVGDAKVSGVSTFTGAVSFGTSAYFGDNDSLYFGDSNDLQIYHNGSNSYIDDTGTGNLFIRSNFIDLTNASGSERYAYFQDNGAVGLYFKNSNKFETTGYGATVFGTLQAQGLQVNSGVSTVGFLTATNIWNAGITTSSRLTLNGANNTATGGGQIYLNGATGNRIDFNQNGVAAPAFTTRSAGTKIVLFPAISGSEVDHALGIESSTLWYSVPDNTRQHRWYAGTTQLADLKGTGELVIGSTSLTGTASQTLQVTGGAYVSGNLGVGNTNPGAKLDVSGDIRLSAADPEIEFNTGGPRLKVPEANTLTIHTGGGLNSTSSEVIRINNTGVGIGTTNPQYKLHVVGSFGATTKSFIIDHPTKQGMKLRYGSLEGPENGVYVRGRLKDNTTIELPDYWTGLVDETSITVNLTPIGRKSPLHSVIEISNNTIEIESANDVIDCFYTVFAERKDVEKLEVEF